MPKRVSEEELVQLIEQAFSSAAYPGDDKIVGRFTQWDDYKVQWTLEGKHWREVTAEMIASKIKADLWLLTPEAYRFYSPAFLIASLVGDYRGEVVGDTLYGLAPAIHEQSGVTEFSDKMNGFTVQQKEAVKVFITDVTQIKGIFCTGAACFAPTSA